MLCPICGHNKFSAEASAYVERPYLPSSRHALGRAPLHVEMIFTCNQCGLSMSGQTRVDVVCPINEKAIPYPAALFHQVLADYAEGWDIRCDGRRLLPEERENMSISHGWAEAQAHSEEKKNHPPPKGWGVHRAKTHYLKTRIAWTHLKLLSIKSLET